MGISAGNQFSFCAFLLEPFDHRMPRLFHCDDKGLIVIYREEI